MADLAKHVTMVMHESVFCIIIVWFILGVLCSVGSSNGCIWHTGVYKCIKCYKWDCCWPWDNNYVCFNWNAWCWTRRVFYWSQVCLSSFKYFWKFLTNIHHLLLWLDYLTHLDGDEPITQILMKVFTGGRYVACQHGYKHNRRRTSLDIPVTPRQLRQVIVYDYV